MLPTRQIEISQLCDNVVCIELHIFVHFDIDFFCFLLQAEDHPSAADLGVKTVQSPQSPPPEEKKSETRKKRRKKKKVMWRALAQPQWLCDNASYTTY